jgi:dihydrofolate synthase
MSIDLTLDRIHKVAQHLPPYTRPTCHIAGTNGKGSVAALLSSVLRSANPPFTVGRFNSPYLISVHDSININGETVASDVYSSTMDAVKSAAATNSLAISDFEALTLTALQIFESAQVDVVVLEVGMGGRLDATNVIPTNAVLVSALSCVDIDHQSFLGTTIPAIAREKLGIARSGKPFILGHQKYPEVLDVARTVTSDLGAELVLCNQITVAKDLSDDQSMSHPFYHPPPPVPITISIPGIEGPFSALLPLHGEHQLHNLQLSMAITSTLINHPACTSHSFGSRLTADSIAQGIQSTTWRGRLSYHMINIPDEMGEIQRLTVIADGAHNEGSSQVLAKYLGEICSSEQFGASPPAYQGPISLTYILSLSHSPPKTPYQTLKPLLSPAACLDACVINVAMAEFSPPEQMPWIKHVSASELDSVARVLNPHVRLWVPQNNDRKLASALKWAAGNARKYGDNHLTVVAGSLYLVSDLYRMMDVSVSHES